jgi:hypothetical protein
MDVGGIFVFVLIFLPVGSSSYSSSVRQMVLPSRNRNGTATTQYRETDGVVVNSKELGKRVKMDESSARPSRNEEEPSSPTTRYPSTPHPSKKQKTASNDESQADHDTMSMIRNDGGYEVRSTDDGFHFTRGSVFMEALLIRLATNLTSQISFFPHRNSLHPP